VAHFNFCRVHETLRCTPAMESGLTRRPRLIEGRPLPLAADCRGLAPLDEAAEPRRVELEDMGNDLQVVGRERGLDVAVGRDVGHAEVDLARLGTRALDQRDLGMVGPPRPRAGEQVLSPLGRGVTPAPRMFEFVLIADGIATVGFVRAGDVVRSFVLLGGQPASL